MKSLFFLPALLLMLSPLTLQAEQASFGLAEQEKIALLGQAIQARGCPLYQSVRSELQQYYGRSDFSDPNHESGWYRVDEFLTWLKQNEGKIKRERVPFISQHESAKKNKNTTETKTWLDNHQYPVCQLLSAKTRGRLDDVYLRKALSLYLGLRYAQDLFLPGGFSKKPVIVVVKKEVDGGAARIAPIRRKKAKGQILVGHLNSSLPEDINLGIHEGVHLLYWMKNRDEVLLGETASFYAQIRHSLPIKNNLNDICFSKGSRNFLHSVEELGSCQALSSEYAEMLLGVFLYPYLKDQSILSFKLSSLVQKTAAALMDDLAALSQHLLFDDRGMSRLLNKEEVSWMYPNQVSLFPQEIDEKVFIDYSSALLKGQTMIVQKKKEDVWQVKITKELDLKNYVQKLDLPKATQNLAEEMLSAWIEEWKQESDFPVRTQEKIYSNADRNAQMSSSAESFLQKKLQQIKYALPPVPKGYI